MVSPLNVSIILTCQSPETAVFTATHWGLGEVRLDICVVKLLLKFDSHKAQGGDSQPWEPLHLLWVSAGSYILCGV